MPILLKSQSGLIIWVRSTLPLLLPVRLRPLPSAFSKQMPVLARKSPQVTLCGATFSPLCSARRLVASQSCRAQLSLRLYMFFPHLNNNLHEFLVLEVEHALHAHSEGLLAELHRELLRHLVSVERILCNGKLTSVVETKHNKAMEITKQLIKVPIVVVY